MTSAPDCRSHPRARSENLKSALCARAGTHGLVEIDRPMERMKLYPHNFSGGMRQRAVMAIALAARANLTCRQAGDGSWRNHSGADSGPSAGHSGKTPPATILVSHDLGVVARAADNVAVMYAGKIVESEPRRRSTTTRAIPHLGASAGASGSGHGSDALYDPRHAADADRSPKAMRSPAGTVRACHRLRKRAATHPRDGRTTPRHWLLDPPRPESHRRLEFAAMESEILLSAQNIHTAFISARQPPCARWTSCRLKFAGAKFTASSGESGSGKSTAALCVMNLVKPQSGIFSIRASTSPTPDDLPRTKSGFYRPRGR